MSYIVENRGMKLHIICLVIGRAMNTLNIQNTKAAKKTVLSEAVDIIEIFKEEPTGGSLACYLPHHLHSVCRMAS